MGAHFPVKSGVILTSQCSDFNDLANHLFSCPFFQVMVISSKHIIEVFCRNCRSLLLHYRKGGGGQLIKCHLHKITEDFTTEKGICPQCGKQWGREAVIKNRPALRIVGKKVY